jgi:hypothetical protein
MVQQTLLDAEEEPPGLFDAFFDAFDMTKNPWINLFGIPESYNINPLASWKYEF